MWLYLQHGPRGFNSNGHGKNHLANAEPFVQDLELHSSGFSMLNCSAFGSIPYELYGLTNRNRNSVNSMGPHRNRDTRQLIYFQLHRFSQDKLTRESISDEKLDIACSLHYRSQNVLVIRLVVVVVVHKATASAQMFIFGAFLKKIKCCA